MRWIMTSARRQHYGFANVTHPDLRADAWKDLYIGNEASWNQASIKSAPDTPDSGPKELNHGYHAPFNTQSSSGTSTSKWSKVAACANTHAVHAYLAHIWRRCARPARAAFVDRCSIHGPVHWPHVARCLLASICLQNWASMETTIYFGLNRLYAYICFFSPFVYNLGFKCSHVVLYHKKYQMYSMWLIYLFEMLAKTMRVYQY